MAETIDNFLHDLGAERDWDDFTSIRIADPLLESIRRRALVIDLPIDNHGLEELRALLGEAQALIGKP